MLQGSHDVFGDHAGGYAQPFADFGMCKTVQPVKQQCPATIVRQLVQRGPQSLQLPARLEYLVGGRSGVGVPVDDLVQAEMVTLAQAATAQIGDEVDNDAPKEMAGIVDDAGVGMPGHAGITQKRILHHIGCGIVVRQTPVSKKMKFFAVTPEQRIKII